ncbi:hypothetical protein BDN71DRAFT_1496364 [Pleurotus eryngii]|uniref:Uncharacterized protein n=1 Tax=Pleurotus eryngii TaxID=5323 RepID=A0A9P5ZYI3_PLEER|nr:hypothetical protein BDN71DRAFT_1496364 [Pleurotus eryngii]
MCLLLSLSSQTRSQDVCSFSDVSLDFNDKPTINVNQSSPVHEHAAGVELQYHPLLDSTPCNIAGNNLAKGESPPLPPTADTDDFGPFVSQGDFEFTEFLYRGVEMSGGHLNQLAQLLTTLYPDQDPPFVDHNDLYATIDSIEQGKIRWKSFSITYNEQQLANPDFNSEIDYALKLVYKDGKHQYTNFMSGNWAGCETNKIAEDDNTCDGAMLIPIILGSDKTTVSVAMGNNKFYPLYGRIRNMHNNCCEHTIALQEACTLHKAWDNYGVVGDLIPFTSVFPQVNIHEMPSMDLLHQVIEGTYKDHLVEWVVDYINAENLPADAAHILADMDQRIAAPPPFPGLQCFPEGQNFKQWTGDNSKALMKVFLPVIAGHVPNEMVTTIHSFTEFCYLVRHSIIPEDTLTSIELTLPTCCLPQIQCT